MDYEENVEKFMSLFKDLERTIKRECEKYNIKTENVDLKNLIDLLSNKNRIIRKHKDELHVIRKIRNLNAHGEIGNYKYVVYPITDITEKLEKIIKEINNPPMIYDSDICIKRNKMLCKSINDKIEETIQEMINNVFTHIPILENGRLIGVFSESTLLDIVKKQSGIIINENTEFEEYKEELKIENHSMEDFEFISRRKNVYDVEDMFENYFNRKKRLGCIYVTENGKKEESILGMITAWDVLGNSH